MRVALLKLGKLRDLVLSAPAIRAVVNFYRDVALYVSTDSTTLAEFLFPGLEVKAAPISAAEKSLQYRVDLEKLAADLSQFKMVFCLQHDETIAELIPKLEAASIVLENTFDLHESAIQKRAIIGRIPNYSRTEMFSVQPILWPEGLRRVGLCVASNSSLGRWPVPYWLELANQLLRRGIAVSLVGGAAESLELQSLSAGLEDTHHRTILGGGDFRKLMAEVDDCDLIVTTDGWIGHLCSIRKPVVSLLDRPHGAVLPHLGKAMF